MHGSPAQTGCHPDHALVSTNSGAELVPDRHPVNSLAGCIRKRADQRRRERWHARLTDTRRRFAGLHATGRLEPIDNVRLVPATNVSYCVPHTVSTDREHTVYLRVRRPLERSVLRLRNLDGHVIHERKLRYVVPAEMVTLKMRPAILDGLHGDAVHVEVEPR